LALLRLSRVEAAKALAQRALRGLAGFAKSLKLKYSDIEVGFDFDPEPGLADNGDLEVDLAALLEVVGRAAKQAGTAIVLFIDELQYVDESELAALISALHRCNQQKLPVPLSIRSSPTHVVIPIFSRNGASTRGMSLTPVQSTRPMSVPHRLKPLPHWTRASCVSDSTGPTPLQKRYLRAMAALGPGSRPTTTKAGPPQTLSALVAEIERIVTGTRLTGSGNPLPYAGDHMRVRLASDGGVDTMTQSTRL